MAFERKIRYYGYMKSLVATVLKFTSPGVPDIYQGTEVWRYLLTDPDNRLPVNFNKLEKLMSQLPDSVTKLDITDPRTKMLYVKKLLRVRKDYLIATNEYKPLKYGYTRGKVTVIFTPIVTREIDEKIVIDRHSFDLLRNEEIRKGEYKLNEIVGTFKVAVLISS